MTATELWRYLPGRTVKHLIVSPSQASPTCGMYVESVGYWLGDGSRQETRDAGAVAGVPALCGQGGQAVTVDDHVCVPVMNESGEVIARARVSPDLDEQGMRALVNVVEAARRLMAEQDAADPEGAAERGRRQEAGIARVRARARARRIREAK